MQQRSVILHLILFLLTRSSSSAPAETCPADTCAAAQSSNNQYMKPEFILFGDSLTQRCFEEGGWGGRLADHYVRKVDVINRGASGYNTRWGRYLLPRALQTRGQPPKLLTIWFGANDAVLPDRFKARQYVPVPEYKSTLQDMVQLAKDAGVQNVLLITPPPLDEAARVRYNQQADGITEANHVPERQNANTKLYVEACKEAAQAVHVPVLDMFALLPDNSRPEWPQLYFNDGLHFTPTGQKRVFDLVVNSIDTHFPDLRPDLIPDDFPHHSLVNEADPESSLRSL